MNKLNFFKTVFLLSVIGFFTSCSHDDDTPKTVSLESKTYANLFAPQTGGQGQPTGGVFTKFSFSTGAVVTDDSWDIAFRGTTIVVNGGSLIGITDEPAKTGSAAVSIVKNTLDDVKTVPDASTFAQDGANTYAIPIGSENGWYSYDQTTNIISPIAGRIFVVKTHDGKYAKFEIVSYYKDAPKTVDPATAEARYFTFKYVYQPTGTSF